MRTLRMACVVGARPNFMKIAPLLAEMRRRPRFEAKLIHTGQHSSTEMAGAFFRDLGIDSPDLSLEISGGSSNNQVARVMQALEPVFADLKPDLVLVVGDVNATAAAALVAAKANIRIGHVEAGLRSGDRTMPEEINRIVTDALSDYLFTTEASAEANLLREGIPQNRIFFCGNVMIDTLMRFRDRAAESPILDQLGVVAGNYAAVTLHRPANVDDPQKLGEFLGMLECLGNHLPVLFPVHPRTQKVVEELGFRPQRVRLIPPQGYIEFLRILSCARLVLTDSGGIQEETTILGIPCLTMRDNTERPVTITHGTNRLAGTNPPQILKAAEEVLAATPAAPKRPDLWDGCAAPRILDTLERVF